MGERREDGDEMRKEKENAKSYQFEFVASWSTTAHRLCTFFFFFFLVRIKGVRARNLFSASIVEHPTQVIPTRKQVKMLIFH